MPSFEVVEQFDVIEDVGPCVITRGVDTPLDPLTLEQLEEAFGHSIVVAVASPTHRANHCVRLDEALPIVTGVLAALVGMNQQPLTSPRF